MLLNALRLSVRRFSSFPVDKIRVSAEVSAALKSGKGVVALESTVITHGLPRPQNLQLARRLEKVVRNGGAVPATIAFMDGCAFVGLTDEQLQRIANDSDAVKVSRRDIPLALIKKQVGGTTVAATMYLANAVGIRVFATGGLGGVHRGASQTFDISADLLELARTPVTVVCAGVKSILDIPSTLEYLETNSVNVVVYGERNRFPGFFTAETECEVPFATKSLEEIVDLMKCSRAMGLTSGCIVGCPIPAAFAAQGELIENAITVALRESREQKITGKKVTPFILQRVNEITKGASMKTNIALLENNSAIAARLARIFAGESDGFSKADSQKASIKSVSTTRPSVEKPKKRGPSVVVIGATLVDFEAITHADVKNDGGSYRGRMVQRCGGVGRNHADGLTRLGIETKFISAVGSDPHGEFFKRACSHMDLSNVLTITDVPTATYLSFNLKGNVQYGVISVEQIIEYITPEIVKEKAELISTADYLLLDGNISVDTIRCAFEIAKFYGKKTWFEPTDIAKMKKLFDAKAENIVSVISPNLNEFISYCTCLNEPVPEKFVSQWNAVDKFNYLNENKERYLRTMERLILTLGAAGTITLNREGGQILAHRLDAPISPENIVSVSGAGDCFNCGFLAGRLLALKVEESLQFGQSCAAASLQSTDAVPTTLAQIRAHFCPLD